MVKEQASLYFKEASSDKEYHCQIEESASGCIVNFSYGRRGSALQTGSKTASPVPYDQAKKIFDKLIHEKILKGYSPGEAGTPYVGTEKESRVTGITPQLLNVIDEKELEEKFQDSKFCAQEKFDGKRLLLRRIGDKVTAINRKGLEVGFPETLREDSKNIQGDFLMDGEVIGDALHVFDMLESQGKSIRDNPYYFRYRALCEACLGCSGSIKVVLLAESEKYKRALFAEIKAHGGEGIVFKELDSKYHAGRPASGGAQLKYKFTHTCSCIVSQVNGSKRSVALEMCDGAPVGNCTIPANKKIPKPGEIVEIRYLYAYRAGSLYQPFYRGPRDDLCKKDCKISQLHYKQEGSDEDDS